MSEVQYRILVSIKEYRDYYNKYPKIDFIAKRMMYSKSSIRYHLNKLIDMGMIQKNKDKTYSLKVYF